MSSFTLTHLKISFVLSLLIFQGCFLLTEKKPEDNEIKTQQENLAKLPPEKAEEVISEVGGNWLYGNGIGNTTLNLGGIYLFPPYALYVVGNAIIDFSGYEGLYISKLLPEQDEKQFNKAYDNLTSGPGRIAALIADEEFRSKDVIKKRYQKIIDEAAENDNRAQYVSRK